MSPFQSISYVQQLCRSPQLPPAPTSQLTSPAPNRNHPQGRGAHLMSEYDLYLYRIIFFGMSGDRETEIGEKLKMYLKN